MSSWIYSLHLMVLLLCMSCRSYCWYLKNRGVTISVLYLSAIRTHGPCFSFLKTEASPVASVKHFRSLNQKYRKMSKRSSKLKAGLAILHIFFFPLHPFQLVCVSHVFEEKQIHLRGVLETICLTISFAISRPFFESLCLSLCSQLTGEITLDPTIWPYG